MSPAKKMTDLLPDVLSSLSFQNQFSLHSIEQFWTEILGPSFSPLTRVHSFVEGVLTIKVQSATLYTLLTVHEKPRLLRQLQEKFPIAKIVFRVG